MAARAATLRRAIARRFPVHLPFLIPFFALVVSFFFIPVLLNIFLAFTDMDYKLQWELVGLRSYFKLFKDPLIPKIMKNTAIYVSCTLAINVLFGFLLALLTTYYVKSETTGLIFRAFWMLPRMTPPVVYVLLWLWLFDPTDYGLLNMILKELFGMPPQNWLLNYPMAAVILINGMIGASFGMIIFSAAIKSIPPDYIMAAQVDGASNFGIVFKIILPLLKWPIMFVTAWQIISLLESYEYILLTTGGGPFHKTEVWSLFAYNKAFTAQQYGYGAAIAMIQVVISAIAALTVLKIFGFRRLMELARGA
ncbi:TPA: sugar ABC transporter permease [Candidatus Bipolaricaulota bacterium]|nr:sugar ABC transporter permease [Candidatus Bipolaricaulota bacterium]